MKIPVIGVELKRNKTKQARELTDVISHASPEELAAAIEQKRQELGRLDQAIAAGQAKRRKIAAEIKALEGMRKVQLTDTEEEESN